MHTLHEILWELRVEDLTPRLKLLEIKSKRNNKDTIIDSLKAAYADAGLRRIWNSLTELEQAAVAESAYHQDFLYDQRQVAAKYGGTPPFYSPPENKRGGFYSYDPKYATRIHLLLFSSKYTSAYFIPHDIAERLRKFVPEPGEAKPSATNEPPTEEGIEIRNTSHEAIAEVMALLRLAESGDLRLSSKTALPSAVGVRHILSCLPAGDFYPPEVAFLPDKQPWKQEIGSIKPVAWSRLLINAKYVDVQSTKSKLTAKGIKALSTAPQEILRDLWKKWRANTRYDEFNRVEMIKGQRSKGNPMTAKPPRRLAITYALHECPVGKWIDTADFSNFMQAADHTFDVVRDPFRLYFLERQYGHLGYTGFGGWNILQYRYLLCLLFEYAATLGMLDIAYVHPEGAIDDLGGIWGADELEWLSRYDGLRAFRLNDLGAYCLGLTDDYVSSLPESTLELEIGTQRTIRHKELAGLCHPCANAHIAVLVAHAEKFRTVVRKLGLGVI